MRLKVALIGAPHIPVPPPRYGGTELVIANLAEGLTARGHDVTVYARRISTVRCRVRGCYGELEWPPQSADSERIKGQIHAAWALRNAW